MSQIRHVRDWYRHNTCGKITPAFGHTTQPRRLRLLPLALALCRANPLTSEPPPLTVRTIVRRPDALYQAKLTNVLSVEESQQKRKHGRLDQAERCDGWAGPLRDCRRHIMTNLLWRGFFGSTQTIAPSRDLTAEVTERSASSTRTKVPTLTCRPSRHSMRRGNNWPLPTQRDDCGLTPGRPDGTRRHGDKQRKARGGARRKVLMYFPIRLTKACTYRNVSTIKSKRR